MKTPEHIEKKTMSSACWYRTTCGCGCDYSMTMSIDDDDKDHGYVSIDFETRRCAGWKGGRWARLWDRIKTSVKYLFVGYMEMNESFIFQNSQHLRDYSTMLSRLADDLEQIEKNE